MPATQAKRESTNRLSLGKTTQAVPASPAISILKSPLPTSFSAYTILKSSIPGDLYHLTKVIIKEGKVEQIEQGAPTMKIIVADHIASELLR